MGTTDKEKNKWRGERRCDDLDLADLDVTMTSWSLKVMKDSDLHGFVGKELWGQRK